jgi:tetratricopeptide (TPR) repeat protein
MEDRAMKRTYVGRAPSLIALVFFIVLTSNAQNQSVTARADELLQGQHWREAAAAFQSVVSSDPSNGHAWFGLASSLHAMGDYEQAIVAWQRAVVTMRGPRAMYYLASSYAKLSRKDEAFEWLTKALNAGFTGTAILKQDPDLAVLRNDARFAELLVTADKLSKPCLSKLAYQEFAFWVGEWDVRTPQGQEAGSNKVQLAENGCIILENWTGALGGSGKSINFYDQATQKWRQTWIDSVGAVSEMEGEYKDGAMRFQGERHLTNGSRVQSRLTFFNLAPDRVRQVAETSVDGGKTWSINYDFTYLRKKQDQAAQQNRASVK